MNSTATVLVLLVLYAMIGTGTSLALRHRGLPPGTAYSAVLAWPLLLGLFEGGAARVTVGPFHGRIAEAFAAVESALDEPAAAALVSREDLGAVRRSLATIDARIGMVDRLLDDPALREEPLGDRLRLARGHAAAEIEAVLRGLTQLKLQVGLLALVGDTGPARDCMREIGARVRALEEIALA